MKSRLNLAVLLGLALLSSYAYAQFGTKPVPLDTIKIRDDLFVIHNESVPGNTTVLVTNEGAILVDNKFPVDYDNLMAQVRAITTQPIRYVVNTHYHGDHSGNNQAMQKQNVQVVASERARRKMIEGNQPGLPNVTLDTAVRLYLGGKRAEVRYFGRGHTDGDVVVYFPDHRAVAMGDLYTVGQGLPQLVDYPGGGSMRDWPQTIDGVLALDFDAVIPGHGRVMTKNDLRAFRDNTAALGSRVREMLAKKQPRAEIEKMLRSQFGFEDFHVQLSLDGLLVELR